MDSRNFLFISADTALITDPAWQVHREGHGVNTIEHHVFHDFDAGVRHVQENPAPYVIKPLGEVQNVKRLLYVGNEDVGSDVVDVVRAYKKAWGHRMKGFQLQRKVEGVEVAICGFFDGNGSRSVRAS